MLNDELLALLVCPATHQDVIVATPQELELLNVAIREGLVRTVAGNKVHQPVEGALIRADQAVAYRIQDDIPVMLVPEGLAIKDLNLHAHG